MKKKRIFLLSGLTLLMGLAVYSAVFTSKIAAEEKIQGPATVQPKSASTPTTMNGPSPFAMTSVLGNSKFNQLSASDTMPEGYYFSARPNRKTKYYRVNKKTRAKLEEFKHKPATWTGSDPNYFYLKNGEGAYFANVGEYQGKTVDLMMNLEDGFICIVGYSHLGSQMAYNFGSLSSLENIRANITANTTVTYSYFDNATGEPLVIKGLFSKYVGGVYNKAIYDTNQGDGLYVTDKALINYDTALETATKTYLIESKPTDGAKDPNCYVTDTFTASTYKIFTNGTYRDEYLSGLIYATNPVARIKTPSHSLTGSLEEDGSKHKTSFSVTINQEIPDRMPNFEKYGSFEYIIPENDFYKVTSFSAVNALDGSNISSNFTLSGNKLQIKPSFMSTDAFYGKNYEITLNYSLDTTKDYFSFYQDGYLDIPVEPITQTTDLDGSQLSNAVTSRIKWDYELGIEANDVEYGQGDIKRFNKDPEAFKEKVLKDSEAKGTNLNLNTDIPVTITDFVVDSKVGTYPITLSTQDGDITFTKKINVKVKAVPPVVTIPEAGTRVVSSKGMPYSFSGTVSDEDSEDMSLFVTVDDGAPTTIWEKQENTELNQPIDFTYEIPGAQLLVLGDHTVKVYAKDSEGNQSEVAQFTLDVRGYLAFKDMPPETLDFEQAKIGSKGSYSKLNKSVDFSVEDYRGSNTSWKLVGSLTSELQDSATKTTIKDGIIYRDEDGNETPFTTDATVKLSTGKATASKVLFPIKWGSDDKGIFIKTPSDVKKGTYTGGIEMSLVDAP
ncbi:hypothetical protein [Enterococcus crotali]|uniref:hypothetical protein n=1 Tax=Enterococcus crotali TaxID=1453587 RepID=UPI000470F3D2|nr:hypothetical protein [Enterococcus crotali]